jgi:hypothetical protein
MIVENPLTLSLLGNFILLAALVGLSVHHYHTKDSKGEEL